MGADWWDAAQAIGTVGAVVVALLLAYSERRRARRAEAQLSNEQDDAKLRKEIESASLVSAWIEIEPRPNQEGRHYVREATVHVDNQSDRPAYDANVSIGLRQTAERWTPVGPLAVPLPLPVLAPRSRQSWDITLPLLACSSDQATINGHPTAAISFSDPSGQRWRRGFDLQLRKIATNEDSPLYDLDVQHGEQQIGDLLNPMNPITVVIAYIYAMQEGTMSRAAIKDRLLDPSAKGWQKIDKGKWEQLREEAESLGVAAHIHYPAPRVAYVKALRDEAAEQRVDAPGYVEVPVTVFTLRFLRRFGWRIFAIGLPEAVDMIEFPECDLHSDPRSAD